MANKKADAGAIATFLLLMAVFILFYVLLIPPTDRDVLLGEGETSVREGVLGFEGEELLLSAFPGEVSPVTDVDLVREIGTISLFSKTGKEVIDLASLLTLKSRFFNTDVKTLFFNVDNPENIESVNLVFFVNKGNGRLKVETNGVEIYNAELGQQQLPIVIPKALIKSNNNVRFILKSGLFGDEYELRDVKVTVTQKLEKKSASRTFSLTGGEKQGLERATLSYFVNCRSLEDQGTITILLNDRLLYNDFATCDVDEQVVDMPLNRLRTGINNLEFRIDEGDYIIENAETFFEIAERNFPQYNFDVDKKSYDLLFNRCYDECVYDCDFSCGSTICFNECITDCSVECGTGEATLVMRFFGDERKVAAITINEFQLNMNTFSPLYETDITGFIRRGSNSIKIIPKSEFEIESLQIFVG